MADIGKILILPRGTYSSSATYNILDVVRYNGKVWCCKDNNVSGVAPSESAYWTMWIEDGASGSGTGDMTKSVYDTDNDGIVDSAETLDGLTSTIAQLNYLNSTTGNVQTQLNDRIVDPVTKSNGQVLTYDGTNHVWKAETPSSGGATNLNGLSDVTITSATSGQMLKYNGSVWENTAMPTVDQTYNSASTNAQSGTAVAGAITGKANSSDLDSWSSSATAQTVGSDVVVIFDDLDNSYGYDLYCQDELIGITAMTKGTGTNSGIKLTFTLSGATSGVTSCKLRILK